MDRFTAVILGSVFCVVVTIAQAADQQPLQLVHTIPLPQLKEGDFDHFTVDLANNRLFDTAEENSKVLVFDLKTNKLIHTIDDVKAPHSMLYRDDLKKLFVVDSDLGEVRIYDGGSYKTVVSMIRRPGPCM